MLSRLPQALFGAAAGVVGCMLLCNYIESEIWQKRFVMQQPMFEVIGQYNQCDVVKFTSGELVEHFLDCDGKRIYQPNGQWNPGRIRVN